MIRFGCRWLRSLFTASVVTASVTAGCIVVGLTHAAAGADGTPRLNVNDVSFLWPLPKTSSDVEKLIAADEKLSNGSEIWTNEVFQKVLATAVSPEAAVPVPGDDPISIAFFDPAFHELKTWKVAGIRVDPSAPGCDPRLQAVFGVTPQIRLVMQPVTIDDEEAVVHDFTAHVVFDFVKRDAGRTPDGQLVPAVPDQEAFGALVKDLVALKQELKAKGVETDGALGVHPGFSATEVDLPSSLRAILKKHLRPGNLKHLSFMGIKRPEPWIFFGMQKLPSGEFGIRGPANMLQGFPTQTVTPEPKNANLGPNNPGVSTAPLLARNGESPIDDDATGAVAGLPVPQLKDVPDIIANPKFCNALNTDCISCHTETTQRVERNLGAAQAAFVFSPPEGFTGLKPDVVPHNRWNVRNFGWGVPAFFQDSPHSTASQRTANEAADSADFINRTMLSGNEDLEERVSNALTLVMKAKDAENAQKLKALVAGMQALPPEQNPIARALERTKRVHNARFVFLDHETLAVITTFDDEFDTYIDLFIDEVGDVFDRLLVHIKDAPTQSVKIDRDGFRQFVHDHDIAPVGVPYSAYPHLRVRDIRALNHQAESTAASP